MMLMDRMLVFTSCCLTLASVSVLGQTNANTADANKSEGVSKDLSKAATTEKPEIIPAKLICPGKEVPKPFLPLPCSNDRDCRIFGKDVLCCDKRCIAGISPPTSETTHSPTLFGFVQQVCPKEPLPELWEIKTCDADADCSPRICCPETLKTGENVSYCRTAQPVWEHISPKQFVEPIRGFIGYMQCTPPPPPILDLFPKPCQSPLDCFPNLCCQEGGKRYCRPPKRSILTLIADIGQRIIPTHAAREFIKRIS